MKTEQSWKRLQRIHVKKYVDTRANTSNVAAGLLVLTSASMLLGLEVLDSLVSTCTHVDNKTPRSSLPPCNAGKKQALQGLPIPIPTLPCSSPFPRAKSPAWSFKVAKYVARHRTKNCFAGRLRQLVCRSLSPPLWADISCQPCLVHNRSG